MSKILIPFRLLYKGYMVVVLFIPLILLYPFLRFYLKRGGYEKVFRMKRKVAAFFQYAAFMPVSLSGKDNIPEDSPCVICANHTSYLDIIYFYLVFPHHFVFIGKQEIMDWPFFRIFFKGMNIPVDRKNNRSSHRAFVRAKQELENGLSIGIFPEGMIPGTPPEMAPFKNGAFKLAIKKQVPILPVTFVNNWKLLPEDEGIFGRCRPGISKVVVHEPISTDGVLPGNMVTLRERTFTVIDQAIEKENIIQEPIKQ